MSNPASLRLAFIIDAIDNATAKVRAVNAEVDRATAPMRRARAAARELFREAGWDKLQGQWERIRERGAGIFGTVRSLALGFGLASAAAGAAFYKIKATVDEIDRTGDMAAKLKLPVEQLQRMGYAAQLNGGSSDELNAALKKLSLSMVEAINGSQEMQLWFTRAGIPMEKLKKMRVDQVWEAIGDTFQRVGDAGLNAEKKLALLNAVAGRSSDGLVQLLNLGSKGMREFYAEADRLGAVIDGETAQAMGEFNDNFDRLSFSIRGVMALIAKYALPALDEMTKKFTALNIANREEWGRKLGEALGEIIRQLPSFLTALGQIMPAIATLAILANDVAQALGGWDVVIKGIAALVATKLVVDLVLLFSTIASAIPTVLGLAKVLWAVAAGFASVVGMPALLVTGLIAAALAIIKYWEPIKAFFESIWEKVQGFGQRLGAITTAPSQGAPSIYAGESAWQSYRQQQATVGGTVKVELGDGLKVSQVKKDTGSALDIEAYQGAGGVGR